MPNTRLDKEKREQLGFEYKVCTFKYKKKPRRLHKQYKETSRYMYIIYNMY